MTHKNIWRTLFLIAVWALAGCTVDVDAPNTPTVIVSPTLDETAIARLATRTPTTTATNTLTPTNTSTASITPSITASATGTTTATATHTATTTPTTSLTPTGTATATRTPQPTTTATFSATPSITSTPSATPTERSTATTRPSATATSQPTATPAPTQNASPTAAPTQTPTEAIAQLVIPTATQPPSQTFTPFPTVTPDLTRTWVAENVPPGTATPGGIYTPSPSPTMRPSNTALPSSEGDTVGGDGTFFDPNAPASGQESLPVAPVGPSGPSGPSIPEQSAVVISFSGQIVPVLTVPDGISIGPALAQGNIFALGTGGQIAAVNPNGELFVNNTPLAISPASQFGTHPNLSYGDVIWSPGGQRLAFRVDAANPNEFNGIDSGVWVFEPGSNRSWQVFRNTYTGAQLHEQRRVVHIQWSPNGAVLAITVETPLGLGTVFMPADHNVNESVNAVPYADATWTFDSQALIVSGRTWDGGHTVVGHIALDAHWTYTEYQSQRTNGLYMQAAAQLRDGRIAFLGGPNPDAFALYIIAATPGAQPTQMSGQINGQIIATEWNTEHSAVLVTVQVGGQTRLWIVRTDGVAQETTPTNGTLSAAHWR